MDHFRILKRAAEITWKYRALWLIGLLLVLAGGGVMTGFRGSPGSPGSPGGGGGGDQTPSWENPDGIPHITPRDDVVWIIVMLVVALALLLFAGMLVLGVLAAIVRYVTRTSLISMVHQYEESGEQIGFWAGVARGWSRSALRLFLINLVFRAPLALLLMLIIGPIVVLSTAGFVAGRGPGIVFGIILLLMMIPIIFVSIVVRALLTPLLELIGRASVIEELGVWESIRRGFSIVSRNLLSAGLQWLLLVGLGIAWNIVLVPINIVLVLVSLLVSGLPALALGGLAALLFGWPGALIVGLLTFIPIVILLVGVPNTALTILTTVFYSSTWTLTYREMLAIDDDGDGQEDAIATDEE